MDARMPIDASQLTLGMQVTAIEREIRLRGQVYPRQIAAGKMRRQTAHMEIALMHAVLASLRELQELRRQPPRRPALNDDQGYVERT